MPEKHAIQFISGNYNMKLLQIVNLSITMLFVPCMQSICVRNFCFQEKELVSYPQDLTIQNIFIITPVSNQTNILV